MKSLLFIIWMVFTLILTASIVGLLLFIPATDEDCGDTPSTWMQLGRDLLKGVVNK